MQYYLHSFLVEQPDLNWRNPAVERAMHNVLRFWMERGIDGFRIDVMDRIVKDPEMRDNPPNPRREYVKLLGMTALQMHTQDVNWPDIIDYARRIRATVDEYPERMTVGEVFGPPENIIRYYGGDAVDGLHMGFNFPFVRMRARHWDAAWARRHVDDFEAALPNGAWPNYVFGNHDVDRVITRVDSNGLGQARGRLAAMLLLTLRGTPFIYYGEEIGMENVAVPEHLLQDPARKYGRGRDPERTPMQWTRNGGFTGGKAWLPYGDLKINVEDQRRDPNSMLSLYRNLLRVRRASKALTHGDYAHAQDLPAPIFAFTRSFEQERTLTVLNFANERVAFDLPSGMTAAETLVSTHGRPPPSQRAELLPNEGRVLRLK
jgi:alpha-glucosidase